MTKLDAIRFVEQMKLPPLLRAMAALAVSGMDDSAIGNIFATAQEALTKLQTGDRTSAEQTLIDIGLPAQLVGELLDKVTANSVPALPAHGDQNSDG